MRFNVVFHYLGRLLYLTGAFMFVPAAVAVYYHEYNIAWLFAGTAFVVVLAGILLFFFLIKAKEQPLRIRDGFLLVTLAWLAVSFFGAIPFYLSDHFVSFTDAFFESVSGFTTTGASILTDIEKLPRGLLFWRSFTQWIGGMGIIVLAVAVLPQLSIGGMQLLKNELPGPTFEQLKPRIKQTALSLWKVYLLLSVLLCLFFYLLGMNFYESLCHVFSTMSTGGFSPLNESMAAYSFAIQGVTIIFMLLAGANFVLHYAWLHGNFKKLIGDTEFRFYILVVGLATVLIMADLSLKQDYSLIRAFQVSLFQVASINTSTGFVSADFDQWPFFAKGILLILMIIGGCAGSTGGGIKQIRLLLLFKQTRQAIMRHIFPKAVVPVKLDRRVVTEDVLTGVSSLFLIYMAIFAGATLLLLAFNLDLITSASAVIASLSNVGPGLGDVGAIKNYALLPGLVKWLLCFCMIIGRLEFITVLVLFFPATWKK